MMQSLLAAYLEKEGYDISAVLTGKEMFSVLGNRSADLILLDLTLPDEDGLTLARQIRARSSIPIIILTARKGMEDRLAGLDIGADDFLTKPFDPRELVLRVRNVLKRTGERGHEENLVFDFDGWKMDMRARTLTGPDKTEVPLTSGEFNLLAALIKSAGRVLSRDYLLDAIARNDEPPSDRMIDVFVSRLRKKIGQKSGKQDYIVTVPGHGYKFAGSLD
ncbi:MAG: response regulator transcription factor [Rhodospirillaceae bacterium]|nr:response regulator transcription factor [Rhodospirillaceae bacterium]MBL6942208.1 response regulator transcription factor [Rhodospirillales bacterium]